TLLLLLPYNQQGGSNITWFGKSLVRLSTIHISFTTTRYYMHDAHGSWVAGFRWPMEMCAEAFEYEIILRQIPRKRHQAQPAKVSWREAERDNPEKYYMREKPRPRDVVLCRLTLMCGELGFMQMWSVCHAKYPVFVTLLQWEVAHVQGSSD
ncbi:hypothetical protein EDD15DRAFT_2291937, partial [Pisolithus albus]